MMNFNSVEFASYFDAFEHNFTSCHILVLMFYDDALLLGSTHSGLSELVHCLGFFISTGQDNSGISANVFLKSLNYIFL